MMSKFVIEPEGAGFLFTLIGTEGRELLRSHSFTGKIGAQMGVEQAREALADAARHERRSPHGAGGCLVLKDRKGAELARTATVPDNDALDALIDSIREAAGKAGIVDHTKQRRGTAAH